jgi:hypothetical protein
MDDLESPIEGNFGAQLGTFFKLPVELRLMIWEALVATIESTPEGEPSSPSSNPLSILFCSHYLYEEISSHLYSGLLCTIQIDSRYSKHR